MWAESRAWIENWASGLGSNFMQVMERARDFLAGGDYWSESERFDGEYVPNEFWPHFECITGKTVPEDKQHSFFSCSC